MRMHSHLCHRPLSYFPVGFLVFCCPMNKISLYTQRFGIYMHYILCLCVLFMLRFYLVSFAEQFKTFCSGKYVYPYTLAHIGIHVNIYTQIHKVIYIFPSVV